MILPKRVNFAAKALKIVRNVGFRVKLVPYFRPIIHIYDRLYSFAGALVGVMQATRSQTRYDQSYCNYSFYVDDGRVKQLPFGGSRGRIRFVTPCNDARAASKIRLRVSKFLLFKCLAAHAGKQDGLEERLWRALFPHKRQLGKLFLRCRFSPNSKHS
jgi:hypothetical protein